MSTIPVKASRALAIITTVLIIAFSWYPPIQDLADEQVDAGLQRALVSFASARALNGAISVLQGTEISVQPFGVGVTLTLGQVLDPINDLVEEFSSLMLTAAVAFGVQKILLAIGANWVISLLVSALAVAWVALHFTASAPAWVSRALLVLVMIRFVIPVVTLGSDWVFRNLMAPQYEEQQAALDVAAHEARNAAPQTPAEGAADKSLWEKMKDRVGAAVPTFNANYDAIKKSLENLPERIIKIIVIFVMQTIVIPMILLWALYKIGSGVVRPSRVVA